MTHTRTRAHMRTHANVSIYPYLESLQSLIAPQNRF